MAVNGLNLMRDGRLKAGQLTPLIHNRRWSIDSIQVIDEDLRESLTAAILAAIQSHLETLPPGERAKLPRPPEPRKPDEQPAASAKPQNAPRSGETSRPGTPACRLRRGCWQIFRARQIRPSAQIRRFHCDRFGGLGAQAGSTICPSWGHRRERTPAVGRQCGTGAPRKRGVGGQVIRGQSYEF